MATPAPRQTRNAHGDVLYPTEARFLDHVRASSLGRGKHQPIAYHARLGTAVGRQSLTNPSSMNDHYDEDDDATCRLLMHATTDWKIG